MNIPTPELRSLPKIACRVQIPARPKIIGGYFVSIVDDINDISDAVMRLEEENEELRQQLASAGTTEAYDKLIDLLEEDILWQEKHLTEKASPKMKAIVEAYRTVRPGRE